MDQSIPQLTGMQRKLYALYYDDGATQAAIADRLRKTQPAVSRMIGRIAERFEAAGLQPPRKPGQAIAVAPCRSLSAVTNV